MNPLINSLRKAFTLIEMLVVVAIIALLAAILFPVFSSAREKGRQAACESNLKQIGEGLIQYNQDYDEYEPYIAFWGGGSGTTYEAGWQDAVFPYVRAEAVFDCPDEGITSAYAYQYKGGQSKLGSYLANCAFPKEDYFGSPDTGMHGPFKEPLSFADMVPAVTLPEMTSPSTLAFCFDGSGRLNGTWDNPPNNGFAPYDDDPNDLCTSKIIDGVPGAYDQACTQGGNDFITCRHTSEVNILWCDGHCKSITLSQLFNPGPLIPASKNNYGQAVAYPTYLIVKQ